jgi:hypothetical protein
MIGAFGVGDQITAIGPFRFEISQGTQCREETRHVLEYIDLADPQSSRRFR